MDDGTVAVVVSYFDGAALAATIERIVDQVQQVVVVDNGSTDETTETVLRALERRTDGRVVVLRNGANLGIGQALNLGASRAIETRARWILTMDQDTHVSSTMVARLEEAAERDPSIAVAVPQSTRFPVPGWPGSQKELESTDSPQDVDFAITSGSLVRADVWVALGGLREDYFIDYVDFEFCWRVRRAGHRIVIVPSARQTQRYGKPTVARLLWQRRLCSNYPPMRRYYQARNGVVLAGTIRRVGFARGIGWILRYEALNVLLFEDDKRAKLSAMALGLLDAARGRMGPLDTRGESRKQNDRAGARKKGKT